MFIYQRGIQEGILVLFFSLERHLRGHPRGHFIMFTYYTGIQEGSLLCFVHLKYTLVGI